MISASADIANKWDRLRGTERAESVRKDIAHGLRFMDDAPVLNSGATAQNLNPAADLVVIRRIAIINKVSAFV